MEDEGKTKKQLISEVIELRQWVAELNDTETERRQAGAALRKAHDELERRVEERTAELVKAVTSVRKEIEERKRAEEALRKSYTEIEQLKDRFQAESEYLRAEIKLIHSHVEIVGESEAIKRVFLQIEQVAPTESLVLITGETGTGKELIARAIHNFSKRKDRAMVKVDCASLPSALVESELFGRQKGAYTGALTSQVGRFEVANGSSIFLDEIGELSPELPLEELSFPLKFRIKDEDRYFEVHLWFGRTHS